MADPECPEGFICSFTPTNIGREPGPPTPWWQDDMGFVAIMGLIIAAAFCICYLYYWRIERIRKREENEKQERAEKRSYEDRARESREIRLHELAMLKLDKGVIVEEDSVCAECDGPVPGSDYLCGECRNGAASLS